jgi:DNA polymerase I
VTSQTTLTESEVFLQGLHHSTVVAIDTETTGLDVVSGRHYLMGLSLAFRAGGTVYSEYFPFRHETDNHDIGELDYIAEILYDKQLVFFNAKFDMHSLKTIGIDVSDFTGMRYDALLLAHMVNEEYPRHKSLDNVAHMYIQKGKHEKDKMDALTKAIGWGSISPGVMREYARGDAEVTLELFEELWKRYCKMFGQDAVRLWEDEKKAQNVLFHMEQAGVGVDLKFCRQYAAIAELEMMEIEDELGFKPSKPTELGPYMFQTLGLPVLNYTPGGRPSLAKADMEEYDRMLALPEFPSSARRVLDYRGWQKASSTFYKPFQSLVDSKGNIHCNYKQHGTVTGRLSCAEPNLQQIPRTTKQAWNGKIRGAFRAEEGYSLIGFDYSQLELRLAAAYGQEGDLIDEFSKDSADPFTRYSTVIGATRYTTKTFFYAMIYGAGKEKIAKTLNQPLSTIEPKYDAFVAAIPGVIRAKKLAETKARQRGYIRYWTGRRRHFRNPDDTFKAFNALLQGGGAEVVKQAMIDCFYQVTTNDCRLLLQVHDELVFEIKNEHIPMYSEGIIEIMEGIPTKIFDIPFKVHGSIWGTE